MQIVALHSIFWEKLFELITFVKIQKLILMKYLRFLLTFILLYLFAGVASAQKVYSTNREYDADVKVYVTDKEYEADLVVYLTKKEYRANAHDNKGIWYLTDKSYRADKKIYFVDHQYDADIVVYFTNHEYRAGWRNNRKKPLMY